MSWTICLISGENVDSSGAFVCSHM